MGVVQQAQQKAGGQSAYLTVDEVAAYLQIPRETVYRHARSGHMPAYKVGRHWRFTHQSIDRWVQEQRNGHVQSRLVLIVDDNASRSETVATWLAHAGIQSARLSDGTHVAEYLRAMPRPDLVLLDSTVGATSPIDVLREVHTVTPDTLVVLAMPESKSTLMQQAVDEGPCMLLKKPLSKQALVSTVQLLLQRTKSPDNTGPTAAL